MGLNKKYRLGELIEQSNSLNNEGNYNEHHIRGISNTKEFMPTKADISGRNLSKFQIVKPREFAFNRRTTRMGEKIAIGFNTSDENFIVTEDYVVFHVSDEELLIPDFLFIFLNRSEFDRYVRWDSWGSATEFFNWENMCAVQITLPPLTAQQKAVAVYNGLKENLAAYESGLSNLKLTYEGFMDELKHNARKEKLLNLLQEVDSRNEDKSITEVKGINIDKEFMPTVAKIDTENIRNYKIVKPRQFAFSGMQTGRDCCIRIALLSGEESVIISPAYTTFKVKTENVIPEYIMLWFSRSESDRYGWFASDGSVRSNLDLDRFYRIKIPLPDIKIQQSIADIYSCYIERKRIAEELREELKNICPLLLRGALMA